MATAWVVGVRFPAEVRFLSSPQRPQCPQRLRAPFRLLPYGYCGSGNTFEHITPSIAEFKAGDVPPHLHASYWHSAKDNFTFILPCSESKYI
jgi:hypothetical protein